MLLTKSQVELRHRDAGDLYIYVPYGAFQPIERILTNSDGSYTFTLPGASDIHRPPDFHTEIFSQKELLALAHLHGSETIVTDKDYNYSFQTSKAHDILGSLSRADYIPKAYEDAASLMEMAINAKRAGNYSESRKTYLKILDRGCDCMADNISVKYGFAKTSYLNGDLREAQQHFLTAAFWAQFSKSSVKTGEGPFLQSVLYAGRCELLIAEVEGRLDSLLANPSSSFDKLKSMEDDFRKGLQGASVTQGMVGANDLSILSEECWDAIEFYCNSREVSFIDEGVFIGIGFLVYRNEHAERLHVYDKL